MSLVAVASRATAQGQVVVTGPTKCLPATILIVLPFVAVVAEWSRNPIDRFVAAELQAAGILPGAEASPRVLLRQVHFDLAGFDHELLSDRFNGRDFRLTDAEGEVIRELLP